MDGKSFGAYQPIDPWRPRSINLNAWDRDRSEHSVLLRWTTENQET